MPTKLMEALCGKEREHWKKAWEFEMDRATLKQTWEDVEEEEYTVSDTADLVNSFKKIIPKVSNQSNRNSSFAKRYDRMGQSSTESV